MIDQQLREKLRKIEALFAGAATEGERFAAGAAAERIREKLSETAQQEPESEVKFSISDPWSCNYSLLYVAVMACNPSDIAECTSRVLSSKHRKVL